ncbi:MAG TPA: carbohydrate esterase family 12 protein [Polyangia bacterium]|nr:carbohydrate esterase family 12 protein [Polyangia bacterium]
MRFVLRLASGGRALGVALCGLGVAASLAGCGSKGNGAPTGAGGTGGAGASGLDGGGAAAGADGGAGTAGADAGKDAPSTPATTVYLVGDSTAAAFDDPYYYPRYGWGTQLAKYLDQGVAVDNLALSGRSSKSFIDPADNANYAFFAASIKAGDYVLIGFGHNDEKADPALYTNPNGDVTDPTAFKYFLYTYYIKVAQDKGATPILTTPVVRRDSSGAYAGAKVHVTADVVSGGVTYPGGDYPQAIRDLGAALGVTVIDNTASTLALGKQIFAASGAAGTAQLQAWVSNVVASVDDTHTNVYGGAYYAYLVATGLQASSSALKTHVLPGIVPPDISILVPNPSWMPIVYSPPAKSTLWTTTDPWIGSVFGDVGGQSKITGANFAISETSTSPLVVSMSSGSPTVGAGKIAAATDGIAFYFQQVPIDKDFVLSATATVTSVTFSNSQVGFGLMVRDADWTDVSDPSLLSSYVAVGPLKGNAPATAWSSFIRDTSAPTQLTGTVVTSPADVPMAGSVLNLSIAKMGSTYTCTYGTEPPAVYMIDLNAIDGAYVYAGLFTARQSQIEYSNISLTLSN